MKASHFFVIYLCKFCLKMSKLEKFLLSSDGNFCIPKMSCTKCDPEPTFLQDAVHDKNTCKTDLVFCLPKCKKYLLALPSLIFVCVHSSRTIRRNSHHIKQHFRLVTIHMENTASFCLQNMCIERKTICIPFAAGFCIFATAICFWLLSETIRRLLFGASSPAIGYRQYALGHTFVH